MKTIPENRLREEAESRCREHMTNLVTKAELRFEPKESSTQWDPVSHRHLFRENFTIWREFDDIEVKVGPKGEILSFFDKNRFKLIGPAPKEIFSDEVIIHIADTTGVLGPDSKVEKKEMTLKGMITAVVTQKTAWLAQAIRFTINPTNRQVAAFEVIRKAII